MKFETTLVKPTESINEEGKSVIFLKVEVPSHLKTSLDEFSASVSDDKPWVVNISRKRAKRSLDANSALWAMLNNMAKVLGTTDEELYLVELQRYGVSRMIAVLEEDVERETRQHKICVERGNYYIEDTKVVCLQVWDGSSQYNSKEFSVLLDGVIADAKELGVEFLSAADRNLLLERYRPMKQIRREHG